MDALLTVDDVAVRLGVARGTVLAWLRRGRLRGTQPGGTKVGWRVRERDLERYLDQRANLPAEPG
jgi:excisionase family DNA binding protein